MSLAAIPTASAERPAAGKAIWSLSAVSAVSRSQAWAVGVVNTASGTAPRTLILHWNGRTWVRQSSPNIGTWSVLRGVIALSPSDVWAVGEAELGASSLVEHWDGETWTIVPSPNPGSSENALYSVDAISPTDVWAVGARDGTGSGSLLEHWDGRTWSVVKDAPIRWRASLGGVVGMASDDVWVVGSRGTHIKRRAVLEHWDGTTWINASSAVKGLGSTHLQAVDAEDSGDVWTVGYAHLNKAVAAHWNGNGWHTDVISGVGRDPGLFGLTVIGPKDVWAVGSSYVGGRIRTLTLHWDGGDWSQIPSPSPGWLYGVSAASSKDVWAVGEYHQHQVLQHWDGSSWSITRVALFR